MNEYIVTYIGRKVYPLDPDPDTICIEDIAHALSNKCRFGGHTRCFYSVAQHSIIVSIHAPFPLHGLLHDAAEAYLCDLASTIKPAFSEFKHAEFILMEAIYARFDLPDLLPNDKVILKALDLAALRLEWEALINNPENHSIGVDLSHVPRLSFQLAGFWNPIEAERVFLKRFHELH